MLIFIVVVSSVYPDNYFQQNKTCQSHQWSKKCVSASAVPIRHAELASASMFGMDGKLASSLIYSATLAAGHGAPLSLSTANLEILVRLWRAALNALNTVFLGAPCISSVAAMGYTTVCRLQSWPATPDSRDMLIWQKIQNSWLTR